MEMAANVKLKVNDPSRLDLTESSTTFMLNLPANKLGDKKKKKNPCIPLLHT